MSVTIKYHDKINLDLQKWKYLFIFLHKRKTSVGIIIYAKIVLFKSKHVSNFKRTF